MYVIDLLAERPVIHNADALHAKRADVVNSKSRNIYIRKCQTWHLITSVALYIRLAVGERLGVVVTFSPPEGTRVATVGVSVGVLVGCWLG